MEDFFAHGFFHLLFFRGTRTNAGQGRHLRSLFDDGSMDHRNWFPPLISENFEEFNDWRRGTTSGIFTLEGLGVWKVCSSGIFQEEQKDSL